VAKFAYDPLWRRVEKVAGGVTTSFAYDADSVLRELRGAARLGYIHGRNVDELLGIEDGTAVSYFHTDGLGSVVKVTSSAATVVLSRQYDAWGDPESGASDGGQAFTGRDWDPETRLYYYRARYYEAKSGRFISEDPITFRAGPNFYAYVYSQPTLFIDPEGLDAQVCRRQMHGIPSWFPVPHPVVTSTKACKGFGFGPGADAATTFLSYIRNPKSPRTPGWVYPEEPYEDCQTAKPKPEYSCQTISKNDCVERCLMNEATRSAKDPPDYRVGVYQCNDWADDTVSRCMKACGQKW
jgi:RHS repeat-associated protein